MNMPAPLTSERLRRAAAIVEQIQALQTQLDSLLQGTATVPAVAAKAAPAKKVAKRGRKPGKRTMSPEARARIAEAQKKRWAALKRR